MKKQSILNALYQRKQTIEWADKPVERVQKFTDALPASPIEVDGDILATLRAVTS